MAAEWEKFYESHPPPADFDTSRKCLDEFCTYHANVKHKIVLVTSGGTTVPLEHNTVRFVDNFSLGTRGSTSTEFFLKKGYAVIFLFRVKSLEPFARHFMGQKFLDMLEVKEDSGNPGISVKEDYVHKMLPVLRNFYSARESNRLLQIPFTSLSDYLWLLRAATRSLAQFSCNAMLYLAAAVSDFYVPREEMPVHKMQSSEGPPTITLKLVPKVLKPLVNLWVPEAFVVSFKLETDEKLLVHKARSALKNYKHTLVVANQLHTRKHQVVFVTPTEVHEMALTPEEIGEGIEIESKIVDYVVEKHSLFVKTKS